MNLKQRALLIVIAMNLTFMLSSVVTGDESFKRWSVYRQKAHCVISRQDWLAIAQDPPGFGWMVCNGSTTHSNFASAAAEMDFLKMSECQGETPRCPKFSSDCCKFAVYLSQTGAFSIVKEGDNPGSGHRIVQGGLCCEDAALLAGMPLGCTQLDLVSQKGVRVIRTEHGWASPTGPVTIESNPPIVVAQNPGGKSIPPDWIIDIEDLPNQPTDEIEDPYIPTDEIEDPYIPTDEIEDPYIPTDEIEDPTDGIDEPKPPVVGGRWVLESVTQSPVSPPQGWSYSSGAASVQIYNGDKCSFSWTPPPQQIDSNGFSVSFSVQCTAGTPGASIAGSIAVSGSGISSNPSGQVEAYANGKGSASATKSVSIKPVQNTSSIEIDVSIHWAIGFTYKYRKAD